MHFNFVLKQLLVFGKTNRDIPSTTKALGLFTGACTDIQHTQSESVLILDTRETNVNFNLTHTKPRHPLIGFLTYEAHDMRRKCDVGVEDGEGDYINQLLD